MKSPKGFFVTGTDTGVGKTLCSLGLCLVFKANYWKPIQTGEASDTDFIKNFLPHSRIFPSVYEFKAPLSPNQASRKENKIIDLKKISIPSSDGLIIEGIGGAFVPLNEKETLMDLMKQFALPVIVVARMGLGTLNHTLLTLEVLRRREIEIAGLILLGQAHKENLKDLKKWGNVPILLEVPLIKTITKTNLMRHFAALKRVLL